MVKSLLGRHSTNAPSSLTPRPPSLARGVGSVPHALRVPKMSAAGVFKPPQFAPGKPVQAKLAAAPVSRTLPSVAAKLNSIIPRGRITGHLVLRRGRLGGRPA